MIGDDKLVDLKLSKADIYYITGGLVAQAPRYKSEEPDHYKYVMDLVHRLWAVTND